MKFRCSLKWLAGIISVGQCQSHETHGFLLDPYHEGVLRDEVKDALTSPSLYHSAYNVLFPNERVGGSTFELLIHSLAKKGGYILEENGVIVTDSMLAQTEPFREVSESNR